MESNLTKIRRGRLSEMRWAFFLTLYIYVWYSHVHSIYKLIWVYLIKHCEPSGVKFDIFLKNITKYVTDYLLHICMQNGLKIVFENNSTRSCSNLFWQINEYLIYYWRMHWRDKNIDNLHLWTEDKLELHLEKKLNNAVLLHRFTISCHYNTVTEYNYQIIPTPENLIIDLKLRYVGRYVSP